MNIRSILTSGKMLAVVAALGAGSMVVTDFAEARSGRGGSVGSRGSKTFESGPATNTAPRAAQPVQNSITKPGAAANTATQAASRGGSMMRNLLLGGLIGAGLASLFGAGALANVLGFVLQGLLIAGVVMLAIMLFRRMRGGSSQPAMASATAGAAGTRTPPQENAYRASAAGAGSVAPELQIVGDDFNAFERLLKEVQLGYANGDLKALETRLTPEMLSNFARELDENKRRGVSNDLSEPKLLQGDLAEAWREAGGEYASVDMRYELIDALVDQKSGRVIEGSTTEPQQVVERWTFWRPTGGNARQWELSAIQQV
ncbi:MAG: Tim44 domain-containing protein [Hyphomicrobiaceae bacterium]